MLDKKIKQRTASDVLSRLKWSSENDQFNAENTIMGYDCRVHGPMEKSVSEYTAINEGGDIPQHRIQYFRRVGSNNYEELLFWDRIGRVDRLFSSGNAKDPISPITLANVHKAVMTMKRLAGEQEEKIQESNNLNVQDLSNFKLHRNGESNPVTARFMEILYSDPHPARTMDYDQLMAGLQRAVENKTVLAKKDKTGKLTIYNYIANTWGFFECLARGLIIDKENRKVVATPFPKFFNYGEMTKSFPAGPFQVSEKMDGSLGVAFCYEGNWQVATRGSFQSAQAEWATAWFQSNVASKIAINSEHHVDSTILVEIIYPENRVVVSYDFSALVLLGAYHGNGFEYSRSELEELAAEVDIRLAPLYNFDSVDKVIESATTLPGDKEGWVLRYPSGYRMKIKGDQYCDIHRSISQCTPLTIWGMMKDSEDMDKFAESIPEEFEGDLKRIVSSLEGSFEECLDMIQFVIQATSHLTQKELGMLVPKSSKKKKKKQDEDSVVAIQTAEEEEPSMAIPSWTLNYVFQSRKKGFENGVMLDRIRYPEGNLHAQTLREKLFDRFRPANNTLVGYSPAGVSNRFAE